MTDDALARESLLKENSLLRDRIRELEARMLDLPHVCRTAAAEVGDIAAPATLCRNPQLGEILDTVPASIIIADAASRRLQIVNRRGRELSGISEADVPPAGSAEPCAAAHPTGLTIGEYHAHIQPQRTDGTPLPINELPLYRALVLGDTVRNQELVLRRSDGRLIPILASSAPLRDEDGRIVSAVVVYDDFSERKRMEQTLQENESRQAFLLRLGSTLRPIVDPLEVQGMAAQLLGEWLQASRVFYITIEDNGEFFRIDRGYSTPEAPLFFGRQRLAGLLPMYMEAFRAGRTLAVGDVQTEKDMTEADLNAFASIGIRAHITVPLVKNGRLAGLLAVHCVAPRDWSASEVTLVEQVAGLTWAAVERAAAEKALRDSEQRLRIILENLSDGITLFDIAGGRYTYMSPKAISNWGVTLGEINAMTDADRLARIHPADRDMVRAQRRQTAVGQGQSDGFEYRWIDGDGTVRWFSERLRLVCDDNGRPQALVGISRDITRRRDNERILEKAQRSTEARTQELRTVIDSLPDGLTIYDRNIAPVFLNEPARRFFDEFSLQISVPVAERIAQSRVHTRDGRKLTFAEWPTHITFVTGVMIKDFVIMNRPEPDGAVYYSISTAPIRDPDGAVTGVVALVKDITEQMEDEARLRESEARARALVERLQEADQQKNRFISMLSHELRNPLAAIMLSISLMEHASAKERQSQRAWEVIKRQSAQLTRLVDDLLDVTRITENRITLKKEPVELGLLIQRTVADYEQPLADKGIRLVTDLPQQPVRLEADPVRIAQVIGNLLNNAVKFTDKGGTVTVSLRTAPPEESATAPGRTAAGDRPGLADGAAADGRARPQTAVIRITDTGVGIRPEILDSIFQPFVQADTSLDRRDSGLGLGLAIVRGMVDLHGGHVEGASAGPGKGAEFTVHLPLSAD